MRDIEKTYAHNYSRSAVYFERFSVVLGHFQRHLVPNICWLQKQISEENKPQLWSFEFPGSQKVTESRITRYPYGTYLHILAEILREKIS